MPNFVASDRSQLFGISTRAHLYQSDRHTHKSINKQSSDRIY
ncbi:hypothetical protein [Pseudanabaena sp. FACHB-1998]|nr:hypothetical protein [Pseudanabaena sp. FACHB-1998]